MTPVFDPVSGGIKFQQPAPTPPVIDCLDGHRWTRNANWVAMPAMTGSDEKFVGLFRVDQDGNQVAFTAAGDYTVDWGDGVVENFASGATASHDYDWSNVTITDTSGTLGYKQALVVVTPQAGQQLTALNLQVRHPTLPTGVPNHNWLELAVSMPNASASGLVIGQLSSVIAFSFVEKATIYNAGATTSLSYAFTQCYNIREVYVSGVSSVTSMAFLCNSCACVEKVVINDAAALTTISNSFSACHNIREIYISGVVGTYTAASLFSSSHFVEAPIFDTSKVSDATNMFAFCSWLQKVGDLDMVSCTTMASIFQGCTALKYPPRFLNTGSVTSLVAAFSSCSVMSVAPVFPDTSSVTSFASMFSGCASLRRVPKYDISAATSLNSMFNLCGLLEYVPDFDTANVQNFNAMFSGCPSLLTVPTFDYSSATDMGQLFSQCFSLREVTIDLTTASNCSAASMFNACRNLRACTITAAPKITSIANMFQGCSRLQSVSLPDLPIATSALNLFANCSSLNDVAMGVMPLNASMFGMFGACFNLKTLPSTLTTPSVTNITSVCQTTRALTEIPAYDFNAVTTATTPFHTGLVRFRATNIGFTVSFSACKLKAAAIAEIIGNLKSNQSGKTLTLTGNPGVDAAVTKTGLTTTAKSLTINMADTSSLSVGMLATNATVWAGVSVTSDVAADTLTLTGHNIPNGAMVAFSALSTTTGVTTWTPYYVVNAAANTFQIALTPGGAPIDLTGTNATMTLRWFSKIASINAGVSITLDTPAPTSQTAQSISFRNLDTSLALCKGWTITY